VSWDVIDACEDDGSWEVGGFSNDFGVKEVTDSDEESAECDCDDDSVGDSNKGVFFISFGV